MNRHLLALSTAAALAIATATQAADVNLAPTAAESSPWSGFYVGAHVGLGSASITDDYDFVQEFTFGAQGLAGGLKAGGNMRYGDMLVGLEADFSLTSITGVGLCPDPVCGGSGTNPEFVIDNMGSLRARAGSLLGDVLLFGTFGAGFANATVTDPLQGGTDSQTHLGVLVGAGAEMMVTPDVSLFAEYLHGFYGAESYALVTTPDGINFQTDTIRAGANWHF